ncbi:MAG: PadR family transcriptional regulator [Candidatus Bathyarchaeia archaeon]|nr:PadR family transcriptional regulator [Candidatus Bathyarchaeota archaeon]
MAELEKDLMKAIVRGFSRVIILWLLSRTSMSGYSVSRELKRLTGWSFHPGVVYPLLYELEENRLIKGKWTRRGRRRIKYYSTTESGIELLNRVKKLFEAPLRDVLKDLISQS